MRKVLQGVAGIALLAACSARSDAPGRTLTPRIAAAGLSTVESAPQTPSSVTLEPNPALVDGDTSASAGLDIGYAPSRAGDVAFRDAAVQLADSTAQVTLLRIWTVPAPPPDLLSTWTWSAYSSDDNLVWSAVAASPTLDPVLGTVDLAITATAAHYLKVVTRPLAAGTTSDARYADVWVTELQAFLVAP